LELASGLGTTWPQLRVSGQQSPPPRSDLVPTNLAQIVHFVAVFLETFGEALGPGDLILSGSFCPVALPLGPGVEAHANFGPLGEVCVKVAVA
jgi:2-keto-4-pentenoate hydratase